MDLRELFTGSYNEELRLALIDKQLIGDKPRTNGRDTRLDGR